MSSYLKIETKTIQRPPAILLNLNVKKKQQHLLWQVAGTESQRIWINLSRKSKSSRYNFY